MNKFEGTKIDNTHNIDMSVCLLYAIFLFVSGESGDRSLVVSLEINSIMYQGVLFAQPSSSHLRGKQAPNSSANNSNNLTSNITERKDSRIS